MAGEEVGRSSGRRVDRRAAARRQPPARFRCRRQPYGGGRRAEPVSAGELAIMGFPRYQPSYQPFCGVSAKQPMPCIAANPDVLVIIDSPEFSPSRGAQVRAPSRKSASSTTVCPSVWAWRSGRARAMRSYVDHVLALLPFEPAAMAKLGGPPTDYVGHPIDRARRGIAPWRGRSAPAHQRPANPACAAGQLAWAKSEA